MTKEQFVDSWQTLRTGHRTVFTQVIERNNEWVDQECDQECDLMFVIFSNVIWNIWLTGDWLIADDWN